MRKLEAATEGPPSLSFEVTIEVLVERGLSIPRDDAPIRMPRARAGVPRDETHAVGDQVLVAQTVDLGFDPGSDSDAVVLDFDRQRRLARFDRPPRRGAGITLTPFADILKDRAFALGEGVSVATTVRHIQASHPTTFFHKRKLLVRSISVVSLRLKCSPSSISNDVIDFKPAWTGPRTASDALHCQRSGQLGSAPSSRATC
jgi:hypothetical protein